MAVNIRQFLSVAVQHAAAMLVGVAILLIITPFVAHAPPEPKLVPVFVQPADIEDRASDEVVSAIFQASLVHSGTDQPFTGTGVPGINLKVETAGSVIGWTVQGWANQTVPPNPPASRICNEDSVFFSTYDWAYRAEGGQSGKGFFTTMPSTVPQRIGPDGDQCLMRAGATGMWEIYICIEGSLGGPRGIYDTPDGRHVDRWDRCFSEMVLVEQ